MEGGEKIWPDAIQHCPETPAPLMEPPSTVILDINALVSGSLPLKEITPALDHQVESPGLLTVQGLVLQLDILLSVYTTSQLLPDPSGSWRAREEVHETIKLSNSCASILGWTKFEYCGQQPNRQFLTEDVPQRVDFLLVAFSYNTITGTPHPNSEETWTLEDEARDYEGANLRLHLLPLQWKDDIAFRAGIATLEVQTIKVNPPLTAHPCNRPPRLGSPLDLPTHFKLNLFYNSRINFFEILQTVRFDHEVLIY